MKSPSKRSASHSFSVVGLFNICIAKYKVIIFLSLFLYVIALFAYALKDFRSEDPIPQVKAMTLDMLKEFQDLSAKIRTGLHIKNFPTFDFVQNHFVVDALVWFEYNKSEFMLKTIEKFAFENSTMRSKSAPLVTINGDTILAKYDITFDIKTNLNFKRFPLEDHYLSMILTNEFVSPSEMYFDNDIDALSFTISPNIFLSNWQVDDMHTLSGYSSIFIDVHNPTRQSSHPKVAFIIDFAKNGINRILIIFVPLFAVMFFALFTFLMSFNNYTGKTTLSITAITALLGYRFVMQQMSPSVGYFTIADKIYLFFLVFSLLIFIFQLILLRQYMLLMDREKVKQSEVPTEDRNVYTPKLTERINSIVYSISVVIFITGVTWIVLF